MAQARHQAQQKIPAGCSWRAKGQPQPVQVHDFPHLGEGKAIPYGTYDWCAIAVLNVGITHDTAEFAVESIRQWWRTMGRRLYPDCRRLLICADAGGSNGYRLRALPSAPGTLARFRRGAAPRSSGLAINSPRPSPANLLPPSTALAIS